MLSFLVPARSSADITKNCLESIVLSLKRLGLLGHAEFVLADDHSDPEYGISDLFRAFRKDTGLPTHISRLKKQQHYTGIFAYLLSRARGDNVFFISNDMTVTPAWMRTLLAVAALDPAYGIVRGTAEVVDSHPEHQMFPPYNDRSVDDVFEFSEYMARSLGLLHGEDPLLSGDAVLIKRAVIEKIGVFDRQYFGYFGDPDYGLRAQRAGFKLICAKGAWLKHSGQGYVKAEAQKHQRSMEEQHTRRMQVVQKAYQSFRQKWDSTLPETFVNFDTFDFAKMRSVVKPKGFDFVPPVAVDPALVEIL